MEIELYAGNNLEGTCENIMSEELFELFWKAADEKEDITIYYGDAATIEFRYCESDKMWDTFIKNCKDDEWGDGGYEDSAYDETDLYIPIRTTENYIRNGWP